MFDKEIQASIEVGVELFKDLLLSVSGFAKDKYRGTDPLSRATRHYIGSIIDRYNLVKVLGMREPVPLKSLYVRVNILEKISNRMGLRPEELAEFFDFDRRAFGKKSETVDGEIIVNRLQKFIVLGKPGAGKTTYLKFLTLMMLDPLSQIEQRRLPIFITLREWADEREPLMSFIAKQFHICGFEQADLFVKKMLHDGECLVLLDGLDEVSNDTNQEDIIRQIRNFTDKYAANQFIISCRVAAYNYWFDQFTDVEMADFNEVQMKTFIKNWFHNEPNVTAECWENLKNSPPLRELASVPLLLTLLCLEYSENSDFPPNRAELYERAIETLLKKWDESRQVRRDDAYKQLNTKRKKEMFARIAFGMFTENEYFIRERTLAKMIEKHIAQLPDFNPADFKYDGHDILKAIAANHGIFVERAKGVYSFAHLTFQEYFTAKFIVDNQLNGSLERLVEEHFCNAKWKEVFLLVAGLLDNADELLIRMRIKSNKVLDNPEINALFHLAKGSLLPIDSNYPPEIRRRFAISYAQQISIFSNIATLSSSQPLVASQQPILPDDSSLRQIGKHLLKHALSDTVGMKKALINTNFDRALTHAFNLSFDLFAQANKFDFAPQLGIDLNYLKTSCIKKKLTKQNDIDFEQYISDNLLILNCLKSGCCVSTFIREKMLHELFLPKEDLELNGE